MRSGTPRASCSSVSADRRIGRSSPHPRHHHTRSTKAALWLYQKRTKNVPKTYQKRTKNVPIAHQGWASGVPRLHRYHTKNVPKTYQKRTKNAHNTYRPCRWCTKAAPKIPKNPRLIQFQINHNSSVFRVHARPFA